MWTKRLRTILRLNAATSAVGGLIAAIGAGWVSDTLGIDHVAITRLVGIGLIVFAADVWYVSTRSQPKLVAETLLISVADAIWVAATIVILALGILTTAGTVTAIVLGIGVGDFALTQLWLRAKAKDEDAAQVTEPRTQADSGRLMPSAARS